MGTIKYVIQCLALTCAIGAQAQTEAKPFKGYFENGEYQVYLRINLHDNDVNVPAHDLFGPLPGYLGKKNNSFYWLITDGETQKRKATISLINDYGSEDLTATLTLRNDTTLVLKQGDGSTLKVPNKGKWQKLPKELVFIRK